jgi:hypothetical protein
MVRRTLPVFLLLLVHVLILWDSARQKSATVDELGHLPTGLYSLQTFDFRLNRLVPPMQNLVCAVPVYLFGDYQLSFEHATWKEGIWNGLNQRFVEDNPETFHDNLLLGRTGTMFLSVLLCLAAFCFCRSLFGYYPALVVLVILVFDPNIIAHGRLTTTDTAPALMFVVFAYSFWCYLQKPYWSRLIVTGISLGLAWYAKHSSAIVVLASLLILGWVVWRDRRWARFYRLMIKQKYKRISSALVLSIVIWLCLSAIAGGTLWAGYGFEIGDSIEEARTPSKSVFWRELSIVFQMAEILFGDGRELDQTDPNEFSWWCIRNFCPLFSHWEGFCANQIHSSSGHLIYFLGTSSYKNDRLYYPVLFLLKTPIFTLVMLCMGILLVLTRTIKFDVPTLAIALGIPCVYLYILIYVNNAYLGYRHLLPVLPLLYIFFIGALIQWIQHSTKQRLRTKEIVLCFLLCGLYSIECLHQHPHYLSYFNSFVGGPENGRFYAADSNMDWGQDLPFVKKYIDDHSLDDAFFWYFGPKEYPFLYGIDNKDLRHQTELQRKTYIITVTALYQFGIQQYPWLLPLFNREPDDFITPAVLVFHLE